MEEAAKTINYGPVLAIFVESVAATNQIKKNARTQPTKAAIPTSNIPMTPTPVTDANAAKMNSPPTTKKTSNTGSLNAWLQPPTLKSSQISRGHGSVANGERTGIGDDDGFITSGRAFARRGRVGKPTTTQATSANKALAKATRQRSEAMDKMKQGATTVAKAAVADKNHEAPGTSVAKGKGKEKTTEEEKKIKSQKLAVETAQKVQEREEKKAMLARKKKETSEQKIEKMKANLEKEIAKAKAAEDAEIAATRAASAKAAAISQSKNTRKTHEIRSDKRSKQSSISSVNTVNFSAVTASSPQRKGTSEKKRIQMNEPAGAIEHMDEEEEGVQPDENSTTQVMDNDKEFEGSINELEEGEEEEDDEMKPSRLFDGYEKLGKLTEEEKGLLDTFDRDKPTDNEEEESERESYCVDPEDDPTDSEEEEEMDMTTEMEGQVSDVEQGDEETGMEDANASIDRRSQRLKAVRERAAQAQARQVQSFEESITPSNANTPTSLGRAVARGSQTAPSGEGRTAPPATEEPNHRASSASAAGGFEQKAATEPRTASATVQSQSPVRAPVNNVEAPASAVSWSSDMDLDAEQHNPSPNDMDTTPFVGPINQCNTTPTPLPLPPTRATKNTPDPNQTDNGTPSMASTAESTISSMTSSTLRPTKYAGVSHGTIDPNEMPTGSEGKDIFGDVAAEGTGPGKHLLNFSFEKEHGTRVGDQLHSCLGTAVRLSASSIKNFKLHPHDGNPDLPDIVSEKEEGNFPPTGGGCQQYVHFPMPWQLSAAKEKKSRPAKTQSEHRFDDESGDYSGPETVRGVIVVSADGNVKQMIERMRLDLEGTGISVWWKDVQLKDTVNAIMIPGAVHGFCVEGATQNIYHGLKECEKKLCLKGRQNLSYLDLPLPKMKVVWRDAKKMKGGSELAKKYSLNKLAEFRENGCKILTVEASPLDFGRMGPVWSYFYESGWCRRVLGLKSKVLLIPTGQVDPGQITTMQRYKTLHVKLSAKLEFLNMPDVEVLFKKVEVRMEDGSKPHRKFTCLQQEYYDLRTPSGTPVIDAIVPRLRGMSAGSADITMRMKDAEAVEIARNCARCPAGWWWGLWTLKGYALGMKQALMESFDHDAALLAAHSTFDAKTWTVETAFGHDDDFLEREEALLTDDEDDEQGVQMEIEGDAREQLVSTLRDRDEDLRSINSRGSAASRATNFSSSTGNSSIRSANTAKLARDFKQNTLGLAKANLANANLERIAAEAEEKLRTQQQEAARKEKELMARLHAMEAMMASASSNMDGHASNSSPAKLAAVSAAITKAHHQTGTAQIRPIGITSTIERVVDKRVAAISKSENLGTDTLQENVGPRGC